MIENIYRHSASYERKNQGTSFHVAAMFGFDDHQDGGCEQVDRAVSGPIYHQLVGTQNWNGTSLRVLKSVIVSRIMDPDNISEPFNCTEACFSDDILNVFINPQLQMITEVLTLRFIPIRVDFDL